MCLEQLRGFGSSLEGEMPLPGHGGVTRGCRQGGSPRLRCPQHWGVPAPEPCHSPGARGVILSPRKGQGESWGRQRCQKSPCELCRDVSCCGSPWSPPDVKPPSALCLLTLRLLTALLWGLLCFGIGFFPLAEIRTQWVLTLVPEQRFFFQISKWWLIE